MNHAIFQLLHRRMQRNRTWGEKVHLPKGKKQVKKVEPSEREETLYGGTGLSTPNYSQYLFFVKMARFFSQLLLVGV